MKISLIDLVLIVLGGYTIFLMLKSKCKDYRFGIAVSTLIVLKGIDNVIWKLFDLKEKMVDNYMAITTGTANDKLFLYYSIHIKLVYIIVLLMWIYIIRKLIKTVKYKWNSKKEKFEK